MKPVMIVLLAVILGFFGYYLFTTQAKIQKNLKREDVAQIDNIIVTINNFTFSPQVLKVPSGAEVIFKNNDTTIHTVTGDSFDSGTINEGSSYRRVFNEKGTFEYHCSIHPSMKGTIIVE